MLPSELYSVAQIRTLEQLAIEKYGIDETVLMSRAGEAAFELVQAEFDDSQSVGVIVGKGNNGGDGFVVARLLHQAAFNVSVLTLSDPKKNSATARWAYHEALEAGVDIKPFDPQDDFSFDLIIDAILGIGIKGDVKGVACDAIQKINESDACVLAIDIPSGLDADTGCVLGHAVIAQATITYIGLKQGMLTGASANYCGALYCDDLSLEEVIPEVAINALRVDSLDALDAFQPRPRASHKGDFGHVLVVGGDKGMMGASILAGLSAMRVGAGMVSIATQTEHAAAAVSYCPELMVHGIEEQRNLEPLLARATLCIVGPGMGDSAWSQACFNQVLAAQLPLVVDAGALSLLAKTTICRDDWILTPHPGEAARLLALDSSVVQQDRFNSAIQLHRQYGGIIVLKGSGTLIQAPNSLPLVCSQGNPGMSSAGMGDVLSGVIGGLLAQGARIEDAATLGVILHASAADQCAEEHGERGLMASDLLPYLKKLVNTEQQQAFAYAKEQIIEINDD